MTLPNVGAPVEESVLPGVLQEFREALRAEIDAQRRTADSAAIQVFAGERKSRLANGYQYVFKLEQPEMSLTDDTPGELHVPGRDRLDVLVISAVGVTLTLSCHEDLGEYVGRATLSSNRTALTKRLITRLETLAAAGSANPAGARLLGEESVQGEPRELFVAGLNPEQSSAVGSSLGRDTTFIQGPPGTGKTKTIGAIGAALARDKRSLLVVSHTNTAVDQALWRIAEQLDAEDLASGQAVRIGQPHDNRVAECDDLRLETHVDRRSQGLRRDRAALDEERPRQLEAIAAAERLIALIALRHDMEHARPALDAELGRFRELQGALKVVASSVEAEAARTAEWDNCRREAQAAQGLIDELDQLLVQLGAVEVALDASRAEAASLDRDGDKRVRDAADEARAAAASRTEEAQATLAQVTDDLLAREHDLDRARQLALLAERQRQLPGLDFARARVRELELELRSDGAALAERRASLRDGQALMAQSAKANALTRRMRRLPDLNKQKEGVAALESSVDEAQALVRAHERELGEAREKAAEVQRIHAELDRWPGHPDPLQAENAVAAARQRVDAAEAAVDAASERVEADVAHAERRARELLQRALEAASREVSESERAADALRQVVQARRPAALSYEREHGRIPAQVVEEANHHLLELDRLRSQLDAQLSALSATSDKLTQELDLHLATCAARGIAVSTELPSVELMVQEFDRVAGDLDREISGQTADDLTTAIRAYRARLEELAQEIAAVDEELQRVEAIVIQEATVVATTLTRAYLRDDLQARTFDTVILDEASMAPIPALWAAAAVAERAVVVVGDPHQLPPIALAADCKEPDAPATRWLGRDVFEAAGIQSSDEHLIALRTQYRMHPAISAAPNALVYEGLLRDAYDADRAQRDLADWYDVNWGPDAPLVLVDTEKADAWCSTVALGGRTSRINFLSATIAVDLAERLLKEDRPVAAPGEARVLIATPYRPQARLLGLLLRDQDLAGEVVAGTVHSFQGSEAPVVIYDLVADEPHWRVNLFMAELDDGNRRQFNVGMTRAKHRLFIVGDLKYLRAQGRKAILGRLLEHITPRAQIVDAHDVVPAELSARAARAQTIATGAEQIADAERVIVTQLDFDRYFLRDIDAAGETVVIYSPFLTANRLAAVGNHLRAAAERGCDITVITKALDDRTKSERQTYRGLTHKLESWGIRVIAKKAMHEKVVLIGDSIVWTGSLNPLSFRDTREIMERRKSAKLADDYRQALQLDDVLATYRTGDTRCPVCSAALEVAEGLTGPYLRCPSPDCYKRGLKDEAPRDGKLVCNTCGGDLYFGTWGDTVHWRCHTVPQHRRKVAATHLRLPAMRDLIPRQELARLDRQFGTTPPEGPVRPALRPTQTPKPASRSAATQPALFKMATHAGAANTGEEAKAPPSAPVTLTDRELDVLRLLAEHRSRSQIADALGLTPQTVKTYVRDLNRKFGMHDRRDTVQAARDQGLL